MPSHNFTAPFLHWAPVPQHHQIKSFLLPKIQQHQQTYGKKETGGAITSFFSAATGNAQNCDNKVPENHSVSKARKSSSSFFTHNRLYVCKMDH